MPVPKMVAGPSTAVTNGGEAGANPELPDSAMAAGGVASGGPSLRVGLAGRRRRQLTGAPPPSPLPTARLVPRRTVDPSSRPCKAPGPLWGMDQGKMDENEWGYHGEGNKSLVVAHAQVSDGRRRARDLHPARPFPRPPSTPRCGSAPLLPDPCPCHPSSVPRPPSHTFPLASVCVPTSSPLPQVGAASPRVPAAGSVPRSSRAPPLPRVSSASPQRPPLSRASSPSRPCRHPLVRFPGLPAAVGRGCAARAGSESGLCTSRRRQAPGRPLLLRCSC